MLIASFLFVSLAFDTLAVAIGLGLAGLPRERWFRVGAVFAACEGLMPILGLLLGHNLIVGFGSIAQYLAAGLLVIVGGLAVRESLSEDEDEAPKSILEGKNLWMAGLSVSLDELAIGFSLGSLHVPIGLFVGIIAVQAFAVTLLGLNIGQRLGQKLGQRAELLSGCLLIGLGILLFVNQATGGRILHSIP